MQATEQISVLIVDDHEVVRLGLSTLLREQPNIHLVGEASNGRAAIDLVEQHRPQVVLMDVRMPDMTGIEACREVLNSWPETRVIMLTSYADRSAAMASILAGACGYMLKQVTGAELLQAIEKVAHGGTLVDLMLAREVLEQMRFQTERQAGEAALTTQERHVLDLVGEGKTNREIAQALFLGEKTVRNYVSNVLDKLDLSNRSQAAVYATRRKLLGGPG